MEVAENSAVAQGDYVDPNYDFYNAKNLTNSAENCSTDIQEVAIVVLLFFPCCRFFSILDERRCQRGPNTRIQGVRLRQFQ